MSSFGRTLAVAALAAVSLALPVARAAPQAAQPPSSQRPTIEVAFVLDTTGSMGGLIEGAKRKIFSIASRIAEGRPTPHLKVALVAYRDVGDEYVTRRHDFSADLDTVFGHLRALSANGGGDGPEHVGRALGEAVSKLSWSQGSGTMRLIFLVGDAPPGPRNDGWDFRTWGERAREKGLVVNAVRCGGDAETERHWRWVAQRTDGTFTSIDQTGGMVEVATPYDGKLSRLSAEIASRTLYAGSAPAREESRARAEGMKALSAAAAADRVDFLRKSRPPAAPGAAASAAPEAVAGARDLVAEPEALERVAEADLPEELRRLEAPARQERVRQLAAERRELEQQAARLAAKREAWRARHVTEKADSFDAQVMSGVKAQGARYGLTY